MRRLLTVVLLVAALALVVVAARDRSTPRSLEGRVQEVASDLRCPVCQNLSVADSSSLLAQEMRTRIARDLTAGKSAEQIKAEFVAAYGEWILLSPPRRGISWLPWVVPVALLLVGILVAATAIRRWSMAGPEPEGSE